MASASAAPARFRFALILSISSLLLSPLTSHLSVLTGPECLIPGRNEAVPPSKYVGAAASALLRCRQNRSSSSNSHPCPTRVIGPHECFGGGSAARSGVSWHVRTCASSRSGSNVRAHLGHGHRRQRSEASCASWLYVSTASSPSGSSGRFGGGRRLDGGFASSLWRHFSKHCTSWLRIPTAHPSDREPNCRRVHADFKVGRRHLGCRTSGCTRDSRPTSSPQARRSAPQQALPWACFSAVAAAQTQVPCLLGRPHHGTRRDAPASPVGVAGRPPALAPPSWAAVLWRYANDGIVILQATDPRPGVRSSMSASHRLDSRLLAS